MSNRSLVLFMALAVVASGAVFTRNTLHRRAWRREASRGRPFHFGPFTKPPEPRPDTTVN
ncbi:MAG: hypothetical protein QM742_19260 [Aquabacterium sp.]